MHQTTKEQQGYSEDRELYEKRLTRALNSRMMSFNDDVASPEQRAAAAGALDTAGKALDAIAIGSVGINPAVAASAGVAGRVLDVTKALITGDGGQLAIDLLVPEIVKAPFRRFSDAAASILKEAGSVISKELASQVRENRR
jgi:hypothetical protein